MKQIDKKTGYKKSEKDFNQTKVKLIKQLDKKTYVKEAESIILNLVKEKDVISTNKIRNMLTLINELYNAVKNQQSNDIDDDIQSRIQYVKMRLVYEAGRDKPVKSFLLKTSLLEFIDDIGKSREKLMLLCHYMEALVAYHKFNYEDK